MARNTAHHQRLLSKILESPKLCIWKTPKKPSPLLAVSAGGSWDKVEHQDCDSGKLKHWFCRSPSHLSPEHPDINRWSFGGCSSEVGERNHGKLNLRWHLGPLAAIASAASSIIRTASAWLQSPRISYSVWLGNSWVKEKKQPDT